MKRRKIVFVVMVLGLLLMLASACNSKEPAAETAASAEKEIELLDENTTYEAVIEVALQTGYITEGHIDMLNDWRKDPAHWNV
jgi:orotate phosphoribosyltransferase